MAVNCRVQQKFWDIFGRFYVYKNVVYFTNCVIIGMYKIAELSNCVKILVLFNILFLTYVLRLLALMLAKEVHNGV